MAKLEMDVINTHCAGIDIGSHSHFVAVGQGLDDVKEFGVYAEDLTTICDHLKKHNIKTVAMESTGTYWQNLYVELAKQGFDVTFCNGKFTKNIKGKKTDVKDARWIQKLHSIGLLSGSFLPDDTTETLRTYCRQRTNWLQLSVEATHKMQKYLKLLNFRLDVVVNDECGLTIGEKKVSKKWAWQKNWLTVRNFNFYFATKQLISERHYKFCDINNNGL